MKNKILCIFIIIVTTFFVVTPVKAASKNNFNEICKPGIPNIGASTVITSYGENPYCTQRFACFGKGYNHEIFAYVKIEGNNAVYNNNNKIVQHLDNGTLAYILFRKKQYLTQEAIWKWGDSWMKNVGNKLDSNVLNWQIYNDSNPPRLEREKDLISNGKEYSKNLKAISITGNTEYIENDDGLIGPISLAYTGKLNNIEIKDITNNNILNKVTILSSSLSPITLSEIKSNEKFYIKNNSGTKVKEIKVSLEEQVTLNVDMWFFKNTEVKSQLLLYAIPNKIKEAPSLTIKIGKDNHNENTPTPNPTNPSPTNPSPTGPNPTNPNPTTYNPNNPETTPVIQNPIIPGEIPNQELRHEKIISNIKLTNSQNNVIFNGNPEKDKMTGVTDLDFINNNGSKYVRAELKESDIYGSTLEITYQIKVENVSYVGYYSETDFNKEVTVKVNEITDYLDPALKIKSTKNCKFAEKGRTTDGRLILSLYDIENPILYAGDESINRKDDEPTSLYVEVVAERILSDEDDMYMVNQAIISSAQLYGNPKINNGNFSEEEKNKLQNVQLELPNELREADAVITPPTGKNQNILNYIMILLNIALISAILSIKQHKK